MFPTRSVKSEIAAHECAVLYPTFGHLTADGRTWRVRVAGTVFAPYAKDVDRSVVARLLWKIMQASPDEWNLEIFRSRVSEFLVGSGRGKRIAVRVGDRTFALRGKSKMGGRFSGTLRLSLDEVAALAAQGKIRDGWLHFELVQNDDDPRTFAGKANLIPPQGLSVVSDIDDTVKITEVASRQTLLANTFLREFQSVPGMAEMYRRWSSPGTVFHYVSSSPWQLYPYLEDFLLREGFPAGTFHLRSMRLKDPTVLRLFVSNRWGKRWAIRWLLRSFPQRKFILVGDSSEKDPEIYGDIVRDHPRQVVRAYIRKAVSRKTGVNGVTESAARLERAFRGVPRHLWQVFSDPSEIKPLPAGLLPSG